MMELIDRKALKNDGHIYIHTADGRDYYEVDHAPTIDAVELPLKIGEKCYCILNPKNEIVEDVVYDYDIWSIKNGVKLRIDLKNYDDYVIGEFGKDVFRTREEAEKAREQKWK